MNILRCSLFGIAGGQKVDYAFVKVPALASFVCRHIFTSVYFHGGAAQLVRAPN